MAAIITAAATVSASQLLVIKGWPHYYDLIHCQLLMSPLPLGSAGGIIYGI